MTFRTSDKLVAIRLDGPVGTLPTRVQILVLAPFPGFSKIYQRPSKVLIGVGFAYMYSS
jgi:hypothetical protein